MAVGALSLCLAACGGSSQAGTSGGTAADKGESVETTVSASPEEIYDKVKAAVTLPDMYTADDDFLMNYYGIDAAKLSSYIFASSEDSARVDSVIIMQVKDSADIGSIKDGLGGLLAQMEAEMDNYLPEAYALVKKSAVKEKGNFVYLVISEDADEITRIIEEELK